jgi:hypothetical protein
MCGACLSTGEASLSPGTPESDPASGDRKEPVVPLESIASTGWATSRLRSLSSSKRYETAADAALAAAEQDAADREGDTLAAVDEEGKGVTEARVRR